MTHDTYPLCAAVAPRQILPSSPPCRALAVGLLSLLAAAGCGGSGEDDAPPPAPGQGIATPVGEAVDAAVITTIGAAGGELESADGMVRLQIPAGALAADQVVGVQRITNLAPGALGEAWRLTPEGVTFATPARLTFHFTPSGIGGSAPELLRIASQDSQGYWALHEDVTLDAEEGTVAVSTRHFSDWSLVTGALLSPRSATIKPGEQLPLTLVVCERVPRDDLLAPLIAECRPSQVIRSLTRNWSVNGVPGGDGTVGTVVVQENRSAVYTAPAIAPQPATVAVSTQYSSLQGALVTMVADVHVQSGVCTPAAVGEPCFFDLIEFNGKALPYDDLPRESWENPESIVSGRLSLRDSDGNGDGTWSLRVHWVEERLSGPLEQFEQLAGDFTSTAGGHLQFTVLGGATFTGTIAQGEVTLTGYPFTSPNASVQAQLRLRQP